MNTMPELIIFTTAAKIALPVVAHFRMNGEMLPLQFKAKDEKTIRETAAAWWAEHGAKATKKVEPKYTPEQVEAYKNRTNGRGAQFVGKTWVVSKTEGAKRVTPEEAKTLIASKKWKAGRKW